MILLPERLNDKQIELYNLLNEDRYVEYLFYGSSRAGKTFLIFAWFVTQCIRYGANCLIIRNTFTSLNNGMLMQTVPAVLNSMARRWGYSDYKKVMIGGERFARYVNKDDSLVFYNGSYIKFGSLRGSSDSESKYDSILSTEWGHIFLDEISEISWQPVSKLLTRLAQKLPVKNKMLYALNPCSKNHWSYKRFFLQEDYDTGMKLDPGIQAMLYKKHFSVEDNKENVSSSYMLTMKSLSKIDKRRFLDGEYYDEMEGEIFHHIPWGTMPEEESFVRYIIYVDPSAKESVKNDYKACVLLGLTKDRIWLVDVYAVQGSTYEMLEGIYGLYVKCPITPRLYIEKKQVPLDFNKTLLNFQAQKGWICPIEWDTRNHGNKFYNIESTLDPLFKNGGIMFNDKMKNTPMGEITVQQFLEFSRKESPLKKDDIPDAVAKGVSLMGRNLKIVNPAQKKTKMFIAIGGKLKSL